MIQNILDYIFDNIFPAKRSNYIIENSTGNFFQSYDTAKERDIELKKYTDQGFQFKAKDLKQ